MTTIHVKEFLQRPVVILVGIVLLLTTIPVLEVYLVMGHPWQSITPTFTDETFYLARVQTITKGYPLSGEPYFYEHRNDPPLVVFAGTWLNAVPELLGLPLNGALFFNFILYPTNLFN